MKPVDMARAASAGLDAPLAEGKKHYQQYGCGACHGQERVAVGDLRKASVKYTDQQLQAYIANP